MRRSRIAASEALLHRPADNFERLIQRVATLPHDIQIQIIVETLCEEHCLFSVMLPPEWGLCPDTSKAISIPHVEIYTKGDPSERGANAVAKEHEHVFVRVLPRDINDRPLTVLLRRTFPAAFFHALREAMRVTMHLFQSKPGYKLGPCLELGPYREELAAKIKAQKPAWVDPAAVKYLPFQGNFFGNHNDAAHTVTLRSIDGSEGGLLSSQYRHILLGSNGLDRIDHSMRLPASQHPGFLQYDFDFVQGLLSPEHRKHMILEHRALLQLDWAVLGRNLETLVLDLRWRAAFTEKVVAEAAKDMSANLQLRCLLLIGLRPGRYRRLARRTLAEALRDSMSHVYSEQRPIEELEEVEAFGNLKNWVAAFRGALRPKGELIFVDNQGWAASWDNELLDFRFPV
ncbi:hypothetical protein ACHAQH_000338 [Verticillium albo-atrum]